ERMNLALVIDRADVPQTGRTTLPWRADTHRGTGVRSPRIQTVAAAGARVQSNPALVSRLPAMARFFIRIRARQTGHRCDQWRPTPSRMGGGCARNTARPRGADGPRRTSMAQRAP